MITGVCKRNVSSSRIKQRSAILTADDGVARSAGTGSQCRVEPSFQMGCQFHAGRDGLLGPEARADDCKCG
jgi:hypothetical protein